jgi:hypothetical protein
MKKKNILIPGLAFIIIFVLFGVGFYLWKQGDTRLAGLDGDFSRCSADLKSSQQSVNDLSSQYDVLSRKYNVAQNSLKAYVLTPDQESQLIEKYKSALAKNFITNDTKVGDKIGDFLVKSKKTAGPDPANSIILTTINFSGQTTISGSFEAVCDSQGINCTLYFNNLDLESELKMPPDTCYYAGCSAEDLLFPGNDVILPNKVDMEKFLKYKKGKATIQINDLVSMYSDEAGIYNYADLVKIINIQAEK